MCSSQLQRINMQEMVSSYRCYCHHCWLRSSIFVFCFGQYLNFELSPSAVSVLNFLFSFRQSFTIVYMVSGFNRKKKQGFVLVCKRQKKIWYQAIRFSQPRRKFLYCANFRFFAMSTSFTNSRRSWLAQLRSSTLIGSCN